MQHPPFCPKTKELVAVNEDGYVAWFDGISSWLDSQYRNERRFLARYQACAWADRALRWGKLWLRGSAWSDRGDRFLCETRRCKENARAWRAWEREETK